MGYGEALLLSWKLCSLTLVLLSAEWILPQQQTAAPQGTEPPPKESPGPALQRLSQYVHVSATAKSKDSSRFSNPEDGSFEKNGYHSKYFGFSLPLPPGWSQAYQSPRFSDAGYYVLSALKFQKGDTTNGMILIAATDSLLSTGPLRNAAQTIEDLKNSLDTVYHIERQPQQITIGGKDFVRFDYGGSELHWVTFATDMRCHVVRFAFTSRDAQLLESLVQNMNNISFQTAVAGVVPQCIKDYASGGNIVHKVLPKDISPAFTDVPLRIVIGADGKPEYIHVIAASPQQATSLIFILSQWSFKPFIQNGVPIEVETGILFRFVPHHN